MDNPTPRRESKKDQRYKAHYNGKYSAKHIRITEAVKKKQLST